MPIPTAGMMKVAACPFFALSYMVGQRIDGREYYTLLAGPGGLGGPPGPRSPGAGPRGREQDLFAGL